MVDWVTYFLTTDFKMRLKNLVASSSCHPPPSPLSLQLLPLINLGVEDWGGSGEGQRVKCWPHLNKHIELKEWRREHCWEGAVWSPCPILYEFQGFKVGSFSGREGCGATGSERSAAPRRFRQVIALRQWVSEEILLGVCKCWTVSFGRSWKWKHP